MDPTGTHTHWLNALRDGHDSAARLLWEGYFRRLVGLARQKLGLAAVGGADAEDVALSAFASFCRGARAGLFPRLDDRDDLWQVLAVLTYRKATDAVRREGAAKRGGGAAAGGDPENAADSAPGPDLAAEVADECRRLLDALPDPVLQKIAVAKMEGYTIPEIAGKLGLAVATVERKLHRIRQTWQGGADA